LDRRGHSDGHSLHGAGRVVPIGVVPHVESIRISGMESSRRG